MANAPHELQQGRIHQQAGRRAEARLCYERAVKLDPRSAEAWRLLGALAFSERQPAKAATCFQQALALNPADLETTCNLALAHQAEGKLNAAIAAYRRALELKPDFPEVLCNLGNLLHTKGDIPSAITAYRDALRLRPDFAEVHNSLGAALKAQGRLHDAVESYGAAIAARPTYAAAHVNLALALLAQGQPAEAAAAAEAALTFEPRNVSALLTLGSARQAEGRLGEARATFERLLQFAPQHAGAHSNLGMVLQAQGRLDEAIAAYLRALAAQPDHVEALTNLGTAYQAKNDLPAAIASYRQALARQPELGQTLFNEGVCLLAAGNFREGWPKYEARWQGEQGKFKRTFSQPLWRGETPLTGQTILIYPEQGLGDTLQFVRYLPRLAELGATVILEVQPPLHALLDGFSGAKAVIARGQPLPEFDVHCPLMSLPLALGTVLETIPAAVPYLRAPEEKIALWHDRLAARPAPRIGLVWSGGPHHKSDHLRSIPLEQFKAAISGVAASFFCLQKELKESDARVLATMPEVVPLAVDIGNFTDTAAIIAALDLVVSVDTSVAHLAGALGKPTWLLLPFAPDWRWMLERNDSPWYPTARLFRQPAPGDWGSVLAAVRAALLAFKPSSATSRA